MPSGWMNHPGPKETTWEEQEEDGWSCSGPRDEQVCGADVGGG